MRKLVLASVAALALGGCSSDPALTGAAVGAGAGAIVGGATTGTVTGAAVGAAVGGVSGAIIGAVAGRPGYCYARDRYGRRVVVECPPGYRY